MCYCRYERILQKHSSLLKVVERFDVTALLQQHVHGWEDIVGERGGVIINRTKGDREWRQGEDVGQRRTQSAEWSIDEDLKLVDFFNTHGKNWALCQATFPMRTVNQLKNRFYNTLQKLNETKKKQSSRHRRP